MSELGLHPTLDNLWAINDAAALHDLATAANKELLDEGVVTVYTPLEQTTNGITSLDVFDKGRQTQLAFMFAPPPGIENPMYLTEFDDETFDSNTVPVLARIAITWCQVVCFNQADRFLVVNGAMLSCTETSSILSFLDKETEVEPLVGEFDGAAYRSVDDIVSGLTCYPQLTELARSIS